MSAKAVYISHNRTTFEALAKTSPDGCFALTTVPASSSIGALLVDLPFGLRVITSLM